MVGILKFFVLNDCNSRSRKSISEGADSEEGSTNEENRREYRSLEYLGTLSKDIAKTFKNHGFREYMMAYRPGYKLSNFALHMKDQRK